MNSRKLNNSLLQFTQISSSLSLWNLPEIAIDCVILMVPWPGFVDGLTIHLHPASWTLTDSEHMHGKYIPHHDNNYGRLAEVTKMAASIYTVTGHPLWWTFAQAHHTALITWTTYPFVEAFPRTLGQFFHQLSVQHSSEDCHHNCVNGSTKHKEVDSFLDRITWHLYNVLTLQ